jgi:hypothetical protein
MNNKLQFKVKHSVSDLICFIGKIFAFILYFIERDEVDKFKKMIENFPLLINETKFDDNEPIYYAIRYNNFKIFKYICEKSNKKYDVSL